MTKEKNKDRRRREEYDKDVRELSNDDERIRNSPRRKKRLTKEQIKRRKRKRFFRKLKRTVAAFLIIFLIFAVCFGVFVYSNVNGYLNAIDHSPLEKSENNYYVSSSCKTLSSEKNIKNIAIFGLDKRSDKDAGRSDTILILSINTKTGEMKLASIMRDTFAVIPGHDMQKINAAYALGGATTAVEAVNYNYDMDITDYISVDFSAVVSLVDSIGGVTINVRKDEIENMNSVIKSSAKLLKLEPKYITTPGEQELNGLQALSYCRIRYTDNGDFTRTSRQRIVFSKVLSKVKEQKSLKMVLTLLKNFAPNITTSLSNTEMIKLATLLLKDTFEVKTVNFLTDDTIRAGYMDGTMYVLPYYLKTQAKDLHRALYSVEEYTLSEYGIKADEKMKASYDNFVIQAISAAAVVE